MNTVIEDVKKATVKEVFSSLQEVGFCKEFNGRFHTERNEFQYLILDFVRKTSKGFQKDIANSAFQYKISDKQAWCISFEFDKIRSQFDTYLMNEQALVA